MRGSKCEHESGEWWEAYCVHAQPRTRDGGSGRSRGADATSDIEIVDVLKQFRINKNNKVTEICDRDDESTNVRTGNSSRLLPRLCLARAPTLPPCTRARCSRRARHARCSRRARARASPRMRATNDALRLLPLSLAIGWLSACPALASPARAQALQPLCIVHCARVSLIERKRCASCNTQHCHRAQT